jgi:hypothetical protein
MTHNAESVAVETIHQTVVERPFPLDEPGQRAWCLAHAISFRASIASIGYREEPDENADATTLVLTAADRFLAYVRGEHSDGSDRG